MKVRKAVIPAAGWGTRFLPATKAQPKEMLPLVDKPIIQYVVEEAIASGIEDILIITGRGKRAIEDHFDRSVELETVLTRSNNGLLSAVRDLGNMADIHFIRQKEQLGLGHAVFQARRHIGNEPFAVLLGDEVFTGPTPCLAELLMQAEAFDGSVIAVRGVEKAQVRRYGIVAGTGAGPRLHRVTGMVEKPEPEHAPSNLAIIGRYVLDPEVFDILADLPPGKNSEVQLTDALQLLSGHRSVYAYETESRRYDVGDKLGYLQATVEFALSRSDLSEAFGVYLKTLLTKLPVTLP